MASASTTIAAGRSPVTWASSPCVNVPRWPADGSASTRPGARAAWSSTGSRTPRKVCPMRPEPAPITVLLVEDHRLVAEGLAAMLNATDEIRVVGTAATAADAVRLAALEQPVVVVMDSHLPDGTGADIASRIREGQPTLALAFLRADASEAAMIAAEPRRVRASLPSAT